MSILFILLTGLIYISGERAAFFLFILSFIFIIIFIEKFTKLKIILSVFSLILIVVIITFKFYKMLEIVWYLILLSTIKKSIFTPEHDSLISTAYNMFLDKPIFGHGPKMFRVICKDEKYATGSYALHDASA